MLPLKEISLPAFTPLTLVTTAAGTWPRADRLLLEFHMPTQDLRLRFGDTFTLHACRRALNLLLNDARALPDHSVASRVLTVRSTSPAPRQIALL